MFPLQGGANEKNSPVGTCRKSRLKWTRGVGNGIPPHHTMNPNMGVWLVEWLAHSPLTQVAEVRSTVQTTESG